MKDNLPLVYWTFRTAWTVLHFVVVLAAVAVLLRWGLTDDNAKQLFEGAWSDVLDLQQRVGRAIPWPWDS